MSIKNNEAYPARGTVLFIDFLDNIKCNPREKSKLKTNTITNVMVGNARLKPKKKSRSPIPNASSKKLDLQF